MQPTRKLSLEIIALTMHFSNIFLPRPNTLSYDFNLNSTKKNKYAKYICQMLFSSKVVVRTFKHTRAHTWATKGNSNEDYKMWDHKATDKQTNKRDENKTSARYDYEFVQD